MASVVNEFVARAKLDDALNELSKRHNVSDLKSELENVKSKSAKGSITEMDRTISMSKIAGKILSLDQDY